jgi:hypothetical protein
MSVVVYPRLVIGESDLVTELRRIAEVMDDALGGGRG